MVKVPHCTALVVPLVVLIERSHSTVWGTPSRGSTEQVDSAERSYLTGGMYRMQRYYSLNISGFAFTEQALY
jgi:hypothetical protein